MVPSPPPRYTSEQVDRYLSHINFTGRRIYPGDAKRASGLSYLTALQKHQMAKVPFENLSLHYSKEHHLSLEPQDLYHKVVERGHGGYCMENNCFFGTILRSLGFQIYSAGARVYNSDDSSNDSYSGWSHMINIVTVDGTKYLVDVGFGKNGPTRPMPLVDGIICNGIRPQSLKLQYTNIPENTDPFQRLWVYQYRKDDESPWLIQYCFTELEFLPQDYAIMNYATSTRRTSFFTYKLICTKTILEGEEILGSLVLVGNELKRRLRGRTETLMICETEQQRIDALEKWFDITLTADERHGIKGLVTELKA